MKNILSIIPIIFLMFILSCGRSPENETPTVNYTPKGWLAVSNRYLIEAATGSNTVLKGITFTGGVWFYSAGNPSAASVDNIQFMQSESDFAKVKSWGANVVNFYMNYYWFDGAEASKGFAFMDTLLLWCRKYGLYIVPSITVYPVGGLRGGTLFFSNPTAKTMMKNFWIAFATRYKDHSEIAGYDILNEPNGCSTDDLTNYQLELIDAIRAVDNKHIIFIEPDYGDEDNLYALPRSGLIYNIHYYKPFYFTSQGMPWMASGGVPTNISYPGDAVTNTYEVRADFFPVVPAGTSGWTQYTITTNAPVGANFLFPQVFCNSDSGAEIWFDDIEFSTNGGATFVPFGNGSFEIKNEISDKPLYWKQYQGGSGIAVRTNSHAHTGSYSVYFKSMTGWGEFQTWDWIATAGGLPVVPGQTVSMRFWAKANNASAGKNGMQFRWINVQSCNIDNTWLANSVDKTLQFSQTCGVPIFVGEFSPSLAGKRPDIFTYLNEVIARFNANGFSWTYYPYRETWTATKYMGIYNGAYGLPTSGCTEDSDVLTIISNALKN
jgi:hypothetical protein